MASKKTPDLIVTNLSPDEKKPDPKTPGERWDTATPPDLDWKDHVWPPSGSAPGDIHWAAHFRCSVSHFHRLVKKNNWEHIKAGHVIYVDADYLKERLKTSA